MVTANFYPGIVVAIPRNASASFTAMVGQDRHHYTAGEIVGQIGSIRWQEMFTFAFVRDPYDRMKSILGSVHAHSPGTKIEEIEDYNPIICRPQHEYLDMELDFIGRYENIDEDWAKVGKEIGCKLALPKTNKTVWQPESLTPEQKEFVRDKYQEDFKRFNYAR